MAQRAFHLARADRRARLRRFCFVWEGSVETLRKVLDQAGAKIIEGPIERQGGRDGGRAKGTSLYVRDPDSNLLEFMIYPEGASV